MKRIFIVFIPALCLLQFLFIFEFLNNLRINQYVEYGNGEVLSSLMYRNYRIYSLPTMKSFFSGIPVARPSAQAEPEWRISSSFPLYKAHSPLYHASFVAREIQLLSEQLPFVAPSVASKIKEEFLRRLNEEGEDSAIEYSKNWSMSDYR